jgi:hypothetical protein
MCCGEYLLFFGLKVLRCDINVKIVCMFWPVFCVLICLLMYLSREQKIKDTKHNINVVFPAQG